MMLSERLDTTPAVARLTYHLCHGEAVTVYQAASLTGLTLDGARKMLDRMSLAIPLVFVPGRCGEPGLWMLAAMLECAEDGLGA